MRRIVFLLLLLAAQPAAAPAQAEGGRPQRIVSMNQCTDLLLLMMAEPGRIASISFVTHQPQWTPPEFAETVRDIPANHALAEEILAIRPDLVVTGRYTGTHAVRLLRRLKYEVVEFDTEMSFDDIRNNLRRMGEAIGEPERAERLIAVFDADLSALKADALDEAGIVADVGVNGWMAGEGTLMAETANAAGYRTLTQALGHSGYRHLSLEEVVAASPDVIAPLNAWSEPPSLATNALRHPALRRLGETAAVATIPERLTACGSPEVLKAAGLLVAARKAAGE